MDLFVERFNFLDVAEGEDAWVEVCTDGDSVSLFVELTVWGNIEVRIPAEVAEQVEAALASARRFVKPSY